MKTISILLILLLSSCSMSGGSEMKQLRDKWAEFLIGNTKQLKAESSQKYVKSISDRATKLMETANLDENRTEIWKEYDQWKTNPAHITRGYRNITPIVLAYKTLGTAQYQNKEVHTFITNSLDWMINNVYLADQDYYGNWWDWQIGAPGDLIKMTIMLYDDLTPSQRESYMNSIDNYIQIDLVCKRHTGANLADLGLIKILQALVMEDEALLDKTIEQVKTLYVIVESGDGFYKDGSFIQHIDVPYTGSYGNVLIGRLSNILYLLSGTQWDILDPILYDWLYNSIEPIIYKGSVIDNVRGRSVARSYDAATTLGNGFIESLLKIALIADSKNQKTLESILKSWLEGNKTFFRGNPASVLNVKAQEIMDKSITDRIDAQDKHFAFNAMERNIHRRPTYTFSIARSSTRIAKNESINSENIKPWYQGDGTVSLYTDTIQYGGSYWPTIDPYRMSGVTRVTRPRNVTSGRIVMQGGQSAYVNDFPREDYSFNEYSGGLSLGTYGAAGMSISNMNESLGAKKSWFMFDDEIVFINSGIKDNSSYGVETTIENRRLLSNNNILVNGQELKNGNQLVKTIHIQDNTPSTSLAYYFPTEQNVSVERKTTSGAWGDINKIDKRSTTNIFNNEYALVTFNHGIRPQNASLVYYLLPNATPEFVESYQNPIDLIVEDNIHGAYHKNISLLALNFFAEGIYNNISTSRELTYMEKLNNGSYEVSFADPLFSEKPFELTISDVKSFDASEGVTAKLDNGVLIVSVDTTKNKGMTYSLTYKKHVIY